MSFANVSYLWGVLGILIPIAIHLWNRKKVITIKVGSIKLLQASEPKQSSSIKINEWLLLCLRILTILLLALLLSEPSISITEKPSRISYVVAPSLITDDAFKTILDTLPSEDTRLLADGFPLLKDHEKTAITTVPKYWQLAQKMHAIPSDSIVVFSKGYLSGIHGKRPAIRANTKWVNLEMNAKIEKVLGARLNPTYIELLKINSSESLLSFNADSISLKNQNTLNENKDSMLVNTGSSQEWIHIQKSEPIRIGFVQKDSLVNQIKYLKAAFRTIAKFLKRPIEMNYFDDMDSISYEDLNALVALDKNVPATKDIPIIAYKKNLYANELIEQGSRRNLYFITAVLNSENVIREQLAQKLLKILNQDQALDAIVSKYDNRVVAEKELQPLFKKDKVQFQIARIPLNFWLWMTLILVVIGERIIASSRKQ